jgi:hypothetical protein
MGKYLVAALLHVVRRKRIAYVGFSKCVVNSVTTRIQSISICNGKKTTMLEEYTVASLLPFNTAVVQSIAIRLRYPDSTNGIYRTSILRCHI